MTEQFGNRPTVAVAVLAAGFGTRFESELPKHVHPVAGVPIVKRIIQAAQSLQPEHIAVVVSEKMADMAEQLDMVGEFVTAIQKKPTGTAHAVQTAVEALPQADYVISLLGDTPLITGEVIAKLFNIALETDAKVTLLTCMVDGAGKYGRIEREGEGDNVSAIVEWKADKEKHKREGVTEINSGIMVLKRDWAYNAIRNLEENPLVEETVLTDLVEVAVSEHSEGEPWPVQALIEGIEVSMGVNDRHHQAEANHVIYQQVRERLMTAGVTLVGPDTIFIEEAVTIGRDTTILPGSMICGTTSIGEGCTIGPNAVLTNATIGNNVKVINSTVTDSRMDDESDCGPYAHIRGNSHIGPKVHIGNYAELKATRMLAESKSGHFSYLGDSVVGERTNIGAGSITANYDGKQKNQTTLGNDVFIGCDTILIAPVTVENGAKTGAGSVVNRDVAEGTTVVGIPARQIRRNAKPGEE